MQSSFMSQYLANIKLEKPPLLQPNRVISVTIMRPSISQVKHVLKLDYHLHTYCHEHLARYFCTRTASVAYLYTVHIVLAHCISNIRVKSSTVPSKLLISSYFWVKIFFFAKYSKGHPMISFGIEICVAVAQALFKAILALDPAQASKIHFSVG